MTLDELYQHFDKKWSRIAIELKVTESTVYYWRKRGYISYPTQLVIQEKTKGKFKARQEDAIPPTKE